MILELVYKCGYIVTVEDGVIRRLEAVGNSEKHGVSNIHVRRIGLPDKFIEHGAIKELHKVYGLDAAGIAKEVSSFVKMQGRSLIKGGKI